MFTSTYRACLVLAETTDLLGEPTKEGRASAVLIIDYFMKQQVLVSALMVRYDDVWVVAPGWPSA